MRGERRKEKEQERKEMVLVATPERLSPSAATKPKTVLEY